MSFWPSSFNSEPRRRGRSMDNIFAPEFSAALHDATPPLSAMVRLLLQNIPRNTARSIGLSRDRRELGQFTIMLNVAHFKPSEIEVKTVDNYVVIHGKHEEKVDEHGFVSREFTRRHLLPEGVKPDTVKSEFSPNGVLTIVASRNIIQLPDRNERIVPITIEKPAVKGKKSNKI
ncbi:Protein lethal(2)essential for life [Araneus ventricosus]|uniref:Protein lethal(2)essential for life n=1 Tax=Araneus ventricosus TaxID=182803 RepID=A0A4Y2N5N4_ARAVE|nr:Protein lethal(2)essential for life [Araneus ventricosus]